MIDANSGTGRLLVCGVRFTKFDSITRWRTARYCIPNNPRYDIVEDFAGLEDSLVLGAPLLLIPAPLDCFRGRRVVMVEVVAELELHFVK